MQLLKKILLVFLLTVIIGFSVSAVLAQSNPNEQDLQEKIKELEKKLAETQDKKKTLSSEIAYKDSQIRLTQLQITDTEQRIGNLEVEIASLSGKIEKLELSLNTLSHLLLNRISETYKKGKISYLELFFSATDFSNFLSQFKYIQTVQIHDKKLMFEIQNAKDTFTEKKKIREQKMTEQVELQKRLVSQKSTLDSQKKEKEYLLTITRNDEKRYQDLRAEALRELSQIQEAAAFLKAGGTPVKVKKGDLIGIQGSTGFSTGPHLHFGVYNYSSIDNLPGDWYYSNYIDPAGMLSSKSVEWVEGCGNNGRRNVGSGSWDWPYKSDFEITQGFGYTCYSSALYEGKPHPAMDMAGPLNSAIYAVDEGTAYICRNCLGDGGNGVFIFHPNGKMTLYWHLQ